MSSPFRAPFFGSLPPEHDRRIDDLEYTTAGGWWDDHIGRVPPQAAAALVRYIEEASPPTFAESRQYLRRCRVIAGAPTTGR